MSPATKDMTGACTTSSRFAGCMVNRIQVFGGGHPRDFRVAAPFTVARSECFLAGVRLMVEKQSRLERRRVFFPTKFYFSKRCTA